MQLPVLRVGPPMKELELGIQHHENAGEDVADGCFFSATQVKLPQNASGWRKHWNAKPF